MITYENGQKEVFYKQISTPTTQRSGNKMYSNDLKNEFYRIGTNDIEMLHFFRKNEFVKYYNDFEVVCKKRERGINLLIGGVLTTSLGVILMAAGLKEGYYGMTYIGCGIIGIGHVLTIVSIPVSAVGGAKKRIIKNDFAREYFGVDGYTYQPTLNLGYTGNGIGIALKF